MQREEINKKREHKQTAMEESEKKKYSFVSLKEKDSLIENLDVGKSWKPMGIADGLGKDFDLMLGNKLDLDFNLDGDFGKILSFSMDMSDLDTLSMETAMTKTEEKDSSSVSLKEKDSLLENLDVGKSLKPMGIADGLGMDFDLMPGNKLDMSGLDTDAFSLEVGNLAAQRSPVAHFPNSHNQTPHKTFEAKNVHGTTIIGLASVEDEFIVSVADGRAFVTIGGLSCPVEEDNDEKIHVHEGFIGSCAGSLLYGTQLISKIASTQKGTDMDMEEVLEVLNFDENAWKNDVFDPKNDPFKQQRTNNQYPASVVLYALDNKFFHVAASRNNVTEVEFYVGKKRMKAIAHGKGGDFALAHLMVNKKRILSQSTALECLKESLGAAFLQTNGCAGLLRAAIASRSGGISLVDERQHITQIIPRQFDYLKKYLARMLIIFSQQSSYLKDPLDEKKIDRAFEDSQYCIENVSIMGEDKGLNETIRWLRFHKESDKENFKRVEYDWSFGTFTYSEPTKEVFEWLSELLYKNVLDHRVSSEEEVD